MKLTKVYHFSMPDLLEQYDINVQNKNWKRLDGILACMMTAQIIMLIRLFCGRNKEEGKR